MRLLSKILLFIIILAPIPLSASSSDHFIGVAKFNVNGPTNLDYLGAAARDAVVGSLIQKGYRVQALNKALDPDRLTSVKQGDKKASLLLAGRINIVGQNYRVRLKWVDQFGQAHEDYLQVSNLNDLLPKLETFAATQIRPPQVQVAQPVPQIEVKKKAPQVEEKEVPPPPVAEWPKEPQTTRPEPAISQPERQVVQPRPVEKAPKREVAKPSEPTRPKYIRGYDFISPRLPFEVRGLAYGDVNNDGKPEVLFTSQRKLWIYQFQGENLELLAEYAGKKMDFFVKVDLFPHAEGSSLIVLTNLRGDRAASKILQYSNGKIVPVVEEIPYQLRTLQRKGKWELVGSPYHAGEPARNNVFLLSFTGTEIKAAGKLGLPGGTNLYNFNYVQAPGAEEPGVVSLSDEGKLHYYKWEGDKYKKTWSGREKYGGSGNFIPVKVTNVFNEVVSDYYALPPGVLSLEGRGTPEVVLARNFSLVKNVIGRIPIIGDGQLYRLKYDQLGFVETWESKKIEGSIQDYLIVNENNNSQLYAAIRLRKPGLTGDTPPNDSVLLIYNLKKSEVGTDF